MADTTFTGGTVISSSWLNDVNDTIYNYTGPLGASERALTEKVRETLSIVDFGADAASADNSIPIQNAIDAASSAGARLLFPRGTYQHATYLVFKNNVEYIGEGYQKTRLHYTGTSDGVIVNNPINSSTLANIHVQGIYFYSPSASISPMRASFADQGSSLLTFDRCFFAGSGVGLILDQSELTTVRECYLSATKAGAWLIAGTDRAPTASSFYTNRIKFDGCQFNGGTGYIGLVTDGGTAQEVHSCNFNAGTTYIRSSGPRCLLIQGGEYENCDGTGFEFANTKWQSGVAAPSGTNVTINSAAIFNGNTQTTLSVASGSFENLTFTDNDLDTLAGAVFTGTSNLVTIFAKNNRQAGAGTGLTGINNYYGPVSGTVAWTAATTNPSIGNGTVVSNVSRTGRRVTVTCTLTIGSTTTLGTGNWYFSLPTPATSINDVGSVLYTCAGSLYCGVALVNVSLGQIQLFSASNTTLGVQSTVPGAWTTGDTLQFTVEYSATALIG